MNSKIVCHTIRYCYPDEILYIYRSSAIILRAGRSLKSLQPETTIEYERSKKADTIGSISEQTVTLTTKSSTDIDQLRNMPVVLLLTTDQGAIVVGTKLYSCTVELLNDAKTTTLTFSSMNSE
jgi:hypothetical protein